MTYICTRLTLCLVVLYISISSQHATLTVDGAPFSLFINRIDALLNTALIIVSPVWNFKSDHTNDLDGTKGVYTVHVSFGKFWADFQHWNNPLVVCNNRDAPCGIRSRLKFHKISFNYKNIFVGENIFKCADIMAVKLLSFAQYRRRLRSFRKKLS